MFKFFDLRTSLGLKTWFLLAVALIYAVLFIALQGLNGPDWWDETQHWQASLEFSERPFPTLEQLQNYRRLNTPLPYIVYGMLEYFFQGGIFTGRLFNFVLSIAILCMVGLAYPHKRQHWGSVLSAVGLLLCPYFLWLSGRLYTEIIAAFCVLLGFVCYFRQRHLLSAVFFVLGIAARQYMLAFPLAVATYEWTVAIRQRQRPSLSAVLPTVAAASILGWVVLFGGLVPAESLEMDHVPPVQQTLWALEPGTSLYFLCFVTLYFVIPEWILFNRRLPLEAWQRNKRRYLAIAAGLLVLFLIFPPSFNASGNLIKLARVLPADSLKYVLFYGLAVPALWRFSRPNLAFWLVIFNSLIMLKAYPWDRYVLPLMVVLWYMKAIGRLDDEPFPAKEKVRDSARTLQTSNERI